MMIFDSHCHLNDPAFDPDRAATLDRAWAAGLEGLVVIGAGAKLASNPTAIALAESDSRIYATVGLHPHDASSFDDATIAQLRDWAAHPRVMGIGETGLDYHYDFADRTAQAAAFAAQLALAQELDLPVIIHNREATADILHVLHQATAPIRGIIHCFTGTHHEARAFLDLGLHLSIPGIITFKRTEALRETVAQIPHDRLLLETDSPYLAPVPYRGKRNEPAYLIETATQVATCLALTNAELATLSTQNARRLFAI